MKTLWSHWQHCFIQATEGEETSAASAASSDLDTPFVDTDGGGRAATETEAELVDAEDGEGNPIKLIMITEPASGQSVFSQVEIQREEEVRDGLALGASLVLTLTINDVSLFVIQKHHVHH